MKLRPALARVLPQSLFGRALLAFVVGFALMGAGVPQLRFLWVSFVHAGL